MPAQRNDPTARQRDGVESPAVGGPMTKAHHTRSDGVYISAEPIGGANVNLRALSADLPPVIYAFRMPGNLIKIGYSANLNERRSKLRVTWSDLLAIKPGTLRQEMALHRTLSDTHRHHGEFYFPSPPIIAMLNDWRAAYRMPPIKVTSAA